MTVEAWVIGATINVGGSVCINLGTNLVKLSHNHAQLRNSDDAHR